MKLWLILWVIAGSLVVTSVRGAEDALPVLKVGREVYTNVTVTSVTATDVYFSHSRGMGNAKLKNLEPALQKRFNFNAAKAGEVEKQQREGNAQFRQELATKKPAAPRTPPAVRRPEPAAGAVDIVVPELHARSFRGGPPPRIIVDEWLTPAPDLSGKFVLLDFWATWCGPCRRSIPHLNAFQAKFRDRLVVIGLSDEPPAVIRKMTSPRMEYAVGTDTQGRTLRMAQVRGIPHAILIDPKGIVRFEGNPGYLNEQKLAGLLAKYSQ